MATVLAFGGSLRRHSFNTRLLRAAVGLAPEGMTVVQADIGALPLYNADLDEGQEGGPSPAPVWKFRQEVERADGLLIVSPEYNWSIPGFIKNAIDWVSRPPSASPLAGKPTLLMGASGGPAGTGRGQLHLRQALLSTRTAVLMPSLQLGFAAEHIGEQGDLDEDTAEQARRLMAELAVQIALAKERSAVHPE